MITQNLSHFDILRKNGARPKILSHFGYFVVILVVIVQFYPPSYVEKLSIFYFKKSLANKSSTSM